MKFYAPLATTLFVQVIVRLRRESDTATNEFILLNGRHMEGATAIRRNPSNLAITQARTRASCKFTRQDVKTVPKEICQNSSIFVDWYLPGTGCFFVTERITFPHAERRNHPFEELT